MVNMEGYDLVLSSLVVALSVDRAVLFQYANGYVGGTFIASYGAPLVNRSANEQIELVWEDQAAVGRIMDDEFWSDQYHPVIGLDATSYLYSTVNIGGIVWGAIGVHMLDECRIWHEDDMVLLRSSAGHIGNQLLRDSLIENIALQSRIKKAKLLMQRVIDASPIYLGVKDDSGKFILVNRALSDAAGYDHPRSMIGQEEWGDYFPPDSVGEELAVLANRDTYFSLSSRGRDRWFTVMRVYVGSDIYLPPMVVSTLVDITELTIITKRLEDFTHIASHDLQEPLRTVSAFLGLVKRRHGAELSGKALEYVETAIGASVRMGNLLEDLKAYTRLGAKPKPFSWVPLSNVIMKALKNISGKLTMEICPTIMYDPNSYPNVWGDEVQLITSIQNLISNAIKFGGGSPVQIDCSTSPTHWEITVTDYGVGIPDGMEEAVFAPFKRAHDPTKYEGTGMGLAIVRKVANMHHGNAWATATPGGGTTMHVSIKRP